MASTAVPPPPVPVPTGRTAQARSPMARTVSPARHWAWLAGGMGVAFLVPFLAADQFGMQRDVYLVLYVAAVAALFAGWARDTGQSLGAMLSRRWRLALALGAGFAGVGAF